MRHPLSAACLRRHVVALGTASTSVVRRVRVAWSHRSVRVATAVLVALVVFRRCGPSTTFTWIEAACQTLNHFCASSHLGSARSTMPGARC